MAVPQRSGRRRATLGLLLLLSATLITLDFQSFGPLGTIQTGARELLNPIRDGGDRIASPITGLWRGATEIDDLEAENQLLRTEIDRLRGELVQAGVDRGDFEALLEQNGLALPDAYPVLLARVKGAQIGNFSQTVIEIEGGTTDGVAKDMAVVTAAGLVGRIESVDRTSATVRLVSDEEFVIGAEVGGEVGLARGQNSATQLVIDQGISGNADISIGDPVTTTASQRSLFPANLIIGTVLQRRRLDGGRSTEVVVELAANPVDLRFVNVVLITPGADSDDDADADAVTEGLGQ